MVIVDGDSQIPKSKLDLMAIVSNQSTIPICNINIDDLHRSKSTFYRAIRPSRNSSVLKRGLLSDQICSADEFEDMNPKNSMTFNPNSSLGSSSVRRCAKRIRATLLFLELEVCQKQSSETVPMNGLLLCHYYHTIQMFEYSIS